MFITIGRVFILMFTFPYCVLRFALMDVGSIYNVSESSVFSIVKLQISNDENKHGKMGSSWNCKPASKFTLCGDIGYRYHILLPRVRGLFFLVQFLGCHMKGSLMNIKDNTFIYIYLYLYNLV